MTFIPKTEEDIRLDRDHIDHIDGNPKNNHVSNLRWCTNKENSNFLLAKENKSKARKKYFKENPKAREKNSRALKKYFKENPEAREKQSKAHSKKPIIIDGIEYRGIKPAARELNIPPTTIYRRLNNPKLKNYQYIRELI